MEMGERGIRAGCTVFNIDNGRHCHSDKAKRTNCCKKTSLKLTLLLSLMRSLSLPLVSCLQSIDRVGVPKIIEMTLDALNPQNKIHVSFDIDALDNNVAPSTGTAVRGGLTLREGISIVEALRDTKRVQGMDLVEINPKLGSDHDVQTTVASGLEILKSMFGYRRSGARYYSNLDTGILGSEH